MPSQILFRHLIEECRCSVVIIKYSKEKERERKRARYSREGKDNNQHDFIADKLTNFEFIIQFSEQESQLVHQ